MKILVIWEVIPEEVKYYVNECVGVAEWAWLRFCHGHFLGEEVSQDVQVALDRLNEALETPAWFEIAGDRPFYGPDWTYIVHTGVLL